MRDTKRAVAKFEFEALKKNKKELMMKRKNKLD